MRPDLRPDDPRLRAVRAALLSARLYADALEPNAVVHRGIGVMPLDRALTILWEDAQSNRDGFTSNLTRFRLALALKTGLLADVLGQGLLVAISQPGQLARVLDAALSPHAGAASGPSDDPPGELACDLAAVIEKNGVEHYVVAGVQGHAPGGRPCLVRSLSDPCAPGLLDGTDDLLTRHGWGGQRREAAVTAVRRALESLAGRDHGPALHTSVGYLAAAEALGAGACTKDGVDAEVFAAVAPGLRLADTRPLGGIRKWSTRVAVNAAGVLEVVGRAQIRSDFMRLRKMVDPRSWAEDSLFWRRSQRVGPTGAAFAPDRDPIGDTWSGLLHEVVEGAVVYSVCLSINFSADGEKAAAVYHLVNSPDNVVRDEGYVRITRLDAHEGASTDDRGWVDVEVVKRVDFRDAPFGGPSSSDLLAPSFLASWMRLQVDLWATPETITPQPSPSPL